MRLNISLLFSEYNGRNSLYYLLGYYKYIIILLFIIRQLGWKNPLKGKTNKKHRNTDNKLSGNTLLSFYWFITGIYSEASKKRLSKENCDNTNHQNFIVILGTANWSDASFTMLSVEVTR